MEKINLTVDGVGFDARSAASKSEADFVKENAHQWEGLDEKARDKRLKEAHKAAKAEVAKADGTTQPAVD